MSVRRNYIVDHCRDPLHLTWPACWRSSCWPEPVRTRRRTPRGWGWGWSRCPSPCPAPWSPLRVWTPCPAPLSSASRHPPRLTTSRSSWSTCCQLHRTLLQLRVSFRYQLATGRSSPSTLNMAEEWPPWACWSQSMVRARMAEQVWGRLRYLITNSMGRK